MTNWSTRSATGSRSYRWTCYEVVFPSNFQKNCLRKCLKSHPGWFSRIHCYGRMGVKAVQGPHDGWLGMASTPFSNTFSEPHPKSIAGIFRGARAVKHLTQSRGQSSKPFSPTLKGGDFYAEPMVTTLEALPRHISSNGRCLPRP
jgi:hypothetical protein